MRTFSHTTHPISLSHSFSPAPFSIHNTQITRIHPKFYRFIFSLMCICLFLVKWNFFVLCSIAYLLFAHLSLFVCLISHYSQFLYVSLSVFSFFSIVFNLYMCFLHLSWSWFLEFVCTYFHRKLIFVVFSVNSLQEVILPKNKGSLGFSIIGGTDHSCVPFGANEPGIFISHVSILFVIIRHKIIWALKLGLNSIERKFVARLKGWNWFWLLRCSVEYAQ